MCKVHKLPNNHKGVFKKEKDLQSSGFQKAQGPPGGCKRDQGDQWNPLKFDLKWI